MALPRWELLTHRNGDVRQPRYTNSSTTAVASSLARFTGENQYDDANSALGLGRHGGVDGFAWWRDGGGAGASETEFELQFAGDVARGGDWVTVATAGGALTEFPLCYVAGDVNCSGDVTGLDLAAIQSPAYWNLDLLAAPSARADVNRDGRMTGLDLARVQSPANWNQPTPPVSECGCPRLD